MLAGEVLYHHTGNETNSVGTHTRTSLFGMLTDESAGKTALVTNVLVLLTARYVLRKHPGNRDGDRVR
jgi:hypothetical protein